VQARIESSRNVLREERIMDGREVFMADWVGLK
jgi:hypothetical protein